MEREALPVCFRLLKALSIPGEISLLPWEETSRTLPPFRDGKGISPERGEKDFLRIRRNQDPAEESSFSPITSVNVPFSSFTTRSFESLLMSQKRISGRLVFAI